SGIMRVIEVRLFPAIKDGFVLSQWRDMAKSLQTKVRIQSSELIPINVIVNIPEYSDIKNQNTN
ncbi:MAG TPA: hypothetical protein PKD91_02270, partial [Bacteroidia bacterium]|nr:hypothetical protein [Bacteroidia bacterium]